MKHSLTIILLTLLLFGITTSTTWAAPPAQEATGGFDTLGEIIGTLGLFAAMMAVLALGTEVVIDMLKFFVGLKRKPTALEALDQLGDKLPGQLRDLGADSKALAQLEGLTDSMKQALAPLKTSVEFTEAVKNGEFKTAIEIGEQLAQASGQDLTALKASFAKALDSGIDSITTQLSIDPQIAKQIKDGLLKSVDRFDVGEAAVQALEYLQEEAPALSEAWLRGQTHIIAEQGLEKGREIVLDLFDQQLKPQLEGLGLDQAAIETIRGQIKDGLEQLTGQRYLDALAQLLQGVEQRRFEIQSPLRKLWRWLRNSTFLGPILTSVEGFWNSILGRTPPHGKLDEPWPMEPFTATTVARRLLEYDNYHKDEEASRLRLVRIISLFVGIYLAYILQVDAVVLLAQAFEITAINEQFRTLVASTFLPLPQRLTAGIILSGLAASAGSAFWHDQLEKLQIAKRATTQLEKVVEAVRGGQQQ